MPAPTPRPRPTSANSRPTSPSSAAAPSKPPSGAPSPSRPPRRGNFGRGNGRPAQGDKAEHEILFQTYFKSVGPRTYAAQVKRATNQNQYLVLTEGKRDDATGEVRKTRLFVFSEDFSAFFHMLQETAQFLRKNPVPEEVKKKRQAYWAKQEGKARDEGKPPASTASAKPVAGHPGTGAAVPKFAPRPNVPRSTGAAGGRTR